MFLLQAHDNWKEPIWLCESTRGDGRHQINTVNLRDTATQYESREVAEATLRALPKFFSYLDFTVEPL